MRKTIPLLLGGFVGACGVNQTPEPTAPPDRPSCVPNRDGKITADELPIAIGFTGTFYASKPNTLRMVDLAGDASGWRLDTEDQNDLDIELGPVALGAQWYATQFASGRFVVDAGNGLDGIYHQDDQALWLDGTASQAASETLVRYTDPVAVLRFPLTDGQKVTTIAPVLVGSIVGGLPFIGSDVFTVEVVGRDHLAVPYVEFSPVLRVNTRVERQTGGLSTSRRTTIFMFECFGEVARAESQPDEPAAEFTAATYLRRFRL